MRRKCSCQSAYRYAELLRYAVAAKQRLEQLVPNYCYRLAIEVGSLARKPLFLRTPAQQLLHGVNCNFAADIVRLDLRIKQIPCKGSDEPCRRRAGEAANRLRGTGQFDHALREKTREIEHVGPVRLLDVELTRRYYSRPLPLLHTGGSADLQHHNMCIVVVRADQVGSSHDAGRRCIDSRHRDASDRTAAQFCAKARAICRSAIQHRKRSADDVRPKGKAERV